MKMTEEEAREMISFINNSDMKESIIKNWINEGYIARPIWEEAEEYYHKWLPMPKDTVSDYYSVINKFHDALTAAVERIKELENENK